MYVLSYFVSTLFVITSSLPLQSDINIPLRPAAVPSLYRGRDSIEWPSLDKLAAFRDFVVRAKSARVRVGEELSEVNYP